MLLEAKKTNVSYRYPKEIARKLINDNYGSFDEIHITDEKLIRLYKKLLYENILKDSFVFVLYMCINCDLNLFKIKNFCKDNGLGMVYPTLEIMRKILDSFDATPGLELFKLLIYKKIILIHANLNQVETSLTIKSIMSVLDNRPDLILLGAKLDNSVYTRDELIYLSTLETMPEQYATASRLINTHARKLLHNVSSPQLVIVNTLNSLISKLS